MAVLAVVERDLFVLLVAVHACIVAAVQGIMRIPITQVSSALGKRFVATAMAAETLLVGNVGARLARHRLGLRTLARPGIGLLRRTTDNLKGFLNDTSSFGFIAKENNKIIGFAYCYTLLRPDGKTMFYLHSIGMLPNYQDKGYGSKLLSFIKEYSKEIGCSEMFLITDKGNPRACHVYEKLGGKNDYKDEIVYVYDYEKGDK